MKVMSLGFLQALSINSMVRQQGQILVVRPWLDQYYYQIGYSYWSVARLLFVNHIIIVHIIDFTWSGFDARPVIIKTTS